MSSGRSPRPSDVEAITATAAAWLAQRDDGLSAADAAAFAQWRAADPRHEAAVVRLESTWAALQQLQHYRPGAVRHPDRDLLGNGPRRRVAVFPTPVTLALAAALAVMAALWWRSETSVRESERERATFATAVDGYRRVALPDGSTMELNGATEVRLRYSPAERRVELVRGEAHFSVKPDPARPFAVAAGDVAVRALGTAFNVRLDGGQVEVLVTHGRVAVAADDPLPAAVEASSERGPALLVAAHERTVFPALRPALHLAPAPQVERITPERLREALAWQGPRITFADTPLAEAVAQFNRRNPVQIVLADEALGAIPIGGSFRADHVDAFVRLLAAGEAVAVERPAPDRIILRRAK